MVWFQLTSADKAGVEGNRSDKDLVGALGSRGKESCDYNNRQRCDLNVLWAGRGRQTCNRRAHKRTAY
eukprot:1078591-Amorphochlora_amoeboformis.AAC.1